MGKAKTIDNLNLNRYTVLQIEATLAPLTLDLDLGMDLDLGVNSLGPKYCSPPIQSLGFRVSLILDPSVNPPLLEVQGQPFMGIRTWLTIVRTAEAASSGLRASFGIGLP
jgi:hypothetical protein